LQKRQQQPNTNPAYRQLRNLLPGGGAIAVEQSGAQARCGTFTFTRGDLLSLARSTARLPAQSLVEQGIFI
jgi:hypothetical protein